MKHKRISELTDKAKEWLVKNRIIFIIFLFANVFFIYQHTTGLSEKFVSNVLNARYFFGNGLFFSWSNEILSPLLLGIFSLFGLIKSAFPEYVFIIFVSSLHFFAAVKLARKIRIRPLVFYALTLCPFLLNYGLVANDLLSFSLLELAVFALISKDEISGLFLALASLAKYQTVILFPLIFFNKKRKIPIAAALFLLPFVPWMMYNYFATANVFTSLIENQALHTFFATSQFEVGRLLLFFFGITNYYLFFAILGGFIAMRLSRDKRIHYIMLSIAALTLVYYFYIPSKSPGFLFNLILPMTYFTSFLFSKMREKEFAKKLIIAIIILNIFFSFLFFNQLYPKEEIVSAMPTEPCVMYSNNWIYFNYLDRQCRISPARFNLEKKIDEGGRVVIFKSGMPAYSDELIFLRQLPVIEESKTFFVLGDKEKCEIVKKEFLSLPYIRMLEKEYGIELNRCKMIIPRPFDFICLERSD